MSIKSSIAEMIPANTRIRLLAVWAVVILFSFFGSSMMGDEMQGWSALGIFSLLLATIIAASFGVVREADELAHRLGEPYGTLILTLSIVSIEVILISAVMLGPGEFPTIGKDSIFSVMMIIMNLVIGLCLLLGGLKFGEQEYNSQGSITYISMIIMLGGIGMMLPNFIEGAGGGAFSVTQVISIASLVTILYGFFLFFQTRTYSHLYIQPAPGHMEVRYEERLNFRKTHHQAPRTGVSGKKEILIRTIVLLLMILPIVLLSHHMAVVVDFGIEAAGLPAQLGGVLIAIIVFTPESLTAVKAALNNEFQRAVNLCHGAFVSTVGLSVPAVLVVGLVAGKEVLMGLTSSETILFIITLVLSLLSFSGKRTTPFVGIMHLVLFLVFLLLIFNP